jgi:hypothetical protein
MKSNKSNAKMRIIPIFLVLIALLAVTISSEVDKKIEIGLEFKGDSSYDADNDGIETLNGVVDLTVEGSSFNWNVDDVNLLTKWKITNENGEEVVVCYGSEDGCSFVGLSSSSEKWNDVFYVNYGKDGAGNKNIITSQVIYYDVDLSVPYSDIFYSEEEIKEVKFYEQNTESLSELDVVVKNKYGTDIGKYNVTEKGEEFDLVISNKGEKEEGNKFTGFVISKIMRIEVKEEPESKVEIKNIKAVEDIEAVIDDISGDNLTTEIVAINASELDFEVAEITLAKKKDGKVNAILRCENFNFEISTCEKWEKTNISFVDDGDVIRFNVTGFSAYGGAEISILNVHSYPPLYGEWTVRFNTSGTADLIIKGVNGTTWTNTEDVGSGYDLKFLRIECGDELLDYEWVNDSMIIKDYSCEDSISYETQKELTTGEHILEFRFGGELAYAYNTVSGLSITSPIEKGESVEASASADNGCGSWFVLNTTYGTLGVNCSITATSGSDGCSATIKGISEGTCIIGVDNGSRTNNQSVTVTVQDTQAPANNMTIYSYDVLRDRWEYGIKTVWNKTTSVDVDHYVIKRSEGSAGGGVVLHNVTAGEGSYNFSDLNTSNNTLTDYYYGVVACDIKGQCNDGVWAGPVNVNYMPWMNGNYSRILHLDGTNVSTNDEDSRIAITGDDLKCVGVAYDGDNESVVMIYNITILETYARGNTVELEGITTDCIYFDEDVTNFQNQYDFRKGTTYCTVIIESDYTSKGDKITCKMAPYDGKEYGDVVVVGSDNSVYINNTAPSASNAYINPDSPNESSTLTCNYTFYDVDTDSENTTNATYKWYINNEGLNDFIEIVGENSQTLSGTFDKDDEVMCGVKVQDEETGWLKNALFASIYTNSSTVVIIDNAEPQIIDYSDSSNLTFPTTDGEDVRFNVTWADYEDVGEIAKMYVCKEKEPTESGSGTGNETIKIGNGTSIIYYTNLTGSYVQTIAIKPLNFTNQTDINITNGSTGYVYDLYAFEVDNVGDPIYSNNTPIAEDYNNAFTMGQFNYIKLQYNAQPLPNKRLAIMFCIDKDDSNEIYCGNDMTETNESIHIRGNNVTEYGENYNINSSDGKIYNDSNIRINYQSTGGGDVDPNGCVGTEYCSTSLSSDDAVFCNYTVTLTDNQKSNRYYVKVCDDGDACSIWREETFWVNYKTNMSWVNLTTYDVGDVHNFTNDANLNCTYDGSHDDWVKWNSTDADTNGNLSFTFTWYLNRTGVYETYNAANDENVLTHGNTQEGDWWYCKVTPNDGFSDGNSMLSNIAKIGGEIGGGSSGDGIPHITNVTVNSNRSTNESPISEGSNITFNVYWSDSNSSSLNNVYICNSSSVEATGCIDYEYGRSEVTSNNPVNISFAVEGNWSSNSSVNITVYDDEWFNSSLYGIDFYVNHRPNVTAFEVEYITSSSLTCKYEDYFTDSDSDSLNASYSEFLWWRDDALYPLATAQNLTSVTIPGYTWKCGVKVYDEHILSSIDYINSSDFHGTEEIIAPFIWPLPEATRDLVVNITGYINYSHDNLNVTASAKQNYSVYVGTTNVTGNSTFVGISYSEGAFAFNNTYVVIDENDVNYFALYNLIEFGNHNRTHFKRYNITGREYLWDGTWKINVSPNLESSVSDNEAIRLYNESFNSSKPTGWFNISDLSLFAGYNTLTVRGYLNVTASGNVMLTGMATTIVLYRDNQTPFINTSNIVSASNDNNHTIKFNITENYKINLSTLFINITNQSPIYNVTHRYDNVYYTNESWNWGDNITCSGNNTDQECEVNLNLADGNYSIWISVNDSVNHTNTTLILNYLVDSTKPAAPIITAKSIQNITNLSILWKSPNSTNLTEVQYAVGTSKSPNDGWNNTIGWTNITEDPRNKTIDANNDNYPNESEVLIVSVDYNLTSDDNVSRAGNASLSRFTNGSFMYNCSNSSLEYNPINCTIIRISNDNNNLYYNSSIDEVVYNMTDMTLGGTIVDNLTLVNFTHNFTYTDANHDNNYTPGEAIVFDNETDLILKGKGSAGTLNGIGNDSDAVIVNGSADMWIPLTTVPLSLVNHEFYYVGVQYKNNINLFHSLTGSSLVIKYKVTESGISEDEDNYTGPGAVVVSTADESSNRTLSASWTASIDERYDIASYNYSIGTAKYPDNGWNAIVGWTDIGLNLTANYTSTEFSNSEYYYWNVLAINEIYNASQVNSSEGTLFHDQESPTITIVSVANDTNSSDGWLDPVHDNTTLINATGDENMTCFVSPYDKWYTDYHSDTDKYCDNINYTAVSCNITSNMTNNIGYNITEGFVYNFSIVCQDNLSNGDNKTQNSDVSFTVDWPTRPEIQNLTVWIYDENMTLRGNAYNLSNGTYTDDILECNGTYYDQDGDALTGENYIWKNDDVTIAGQTTYQLNLSVNGSKTNVIGCEYNVTNLGEAPNGSITYYYNVSINNSKPRIGTPIINSTKLENRSNESLNCYAMNGTDNDGDSINYTFKWYKNGVLNRTSVINATNSSDILNYTNSSKGDNWTCSITPSDGEEDGASANSTVLLIVNTGPNFNESNNISNYTWNKNSYQEFNLTPHFNDVDSDNLTYNYTNSDIANITISINQSTGIVTFTPESEFSGVRTLQFNGTDGEYWTSYSNLITLEITNYSINVTLNTPINYYNNSNETIVLNCTGITYVGNNITTVNFTVWNSTGNLVYNLENSTFEGETNTKNRTNATINLTTTYDDVYTWNCNFCDNASNCVTANDDRQFTIDTVNPNVTFVDITETNYSNVSRNWIFINISVNETNLQNTSYSLFNATSNELLNESNYTNANLTHNFTNTSELGSLPEGNYTYNVSVCDYSGKCNSTGARWIVLDTSGPSDVVDVGNRSINATNITINWSAAHDNYSRVKLYKIYRNGTYIANTTSLNYTDLTLNGSTSYNYSVSAYDYAGNEGLRNASILINTSTDTTAPTISVVVNSTPSSSGITINWTTDEIANSSVNYGLTRDLGTLSTNAALSINHSIELSSLSASTTYYYNITSCDAAGLCGNSSEYNFTTDAAAASPAATGGSSGGGGGGGGRSSVVVMGLTNAFVNYNMERNSVLEFTDNGIVNQIKATTVGTDYLVTLFLPGVQTISLNTGDLLDLDLDGDSNNDITIRLNNISDRVASISLRGNVPAPLRVIDLPEQEQRAPPRVEEPVQEPTPPKEVVIEQYEAKDTKTDVLGYAVTAFMALALMGGLVMKEKVRVDYINKTPSMQIHKFIKTSKTKGYKLHEIKKALRSKGWPAHLVEAASLHDAISKLKKKGHNHALIKSVLKEKGFGHKVVDDALMNHFINEKINKRKSVKKIKKELVKAGWNVNDVNKKFPAK